MDYGKKTYKLTINQDNSKDIPYPVPVIKYNVAYKNADEKYQQIVSDYTYIKWQKDGIVASFSMPTRVNYKIEVDLSKSKNKPVSGKLASDPMSVEGKLDKEEIRYQFHSYIIKPVPTGLIDDITPMFMIALMGMISLGIYEKFWGQVWEILVK